MKIKRWHPDDLEQESDPASDRCAGPCGIVPKQSAGLQNVGWTSSPSFFGRTGSPSYGALQKLFQDKSYGDRHEFVVPVLVQVTVSTSHGDE